MPTPPTNDRLENLRAAIRKAADKVEQDERAAAAVAAKPNPKPTPAAQPSPTPASVTAANTPTAAPSQEPQMPEKFIEVLSMPTRNAANVEMQLFGDTPDNAKWLVFQNSTPVGEIRCSDQDDPKSVANDFVKQDYPHSLLRAAETIGFDEVLKSVNTRFYAAAAERSVVYAAAVEKAKADVFAENSTMRKAATDNLLDGCNLVLEAMAKNLGIAPEDPLRVALFEEFAGAGGVGVPEDVAAQAVDRAFRKAGAEFFTRVVAKGQEWKAYAPEARRDLETMVRGASHTIPTVQLDPTPVPGYSGDPELRARAASGSVNLASPAPGGATPADPNRNRFRAGFGLS